MSLIITFRNISNLSEVSDYEYRVLVGDGSIERSKVLESGHVFGHHRSDGWTSLMKRFLKKRVNANQKTSEK